MRKHITLIVWMILASACGLESQNSTLLDSQNNSRKTISGIKYDYDFAKNNLKKDALPIKFQISNKDIMKNQDRLCVLLGYSNLKDTSTTKFTQCHSMSEFEGTKFEMSINGFEPANVYKFRISYFLYLNHI